MDFDGMDPINDNEDDSDDVHRRINLSVQKGSARGQTMMSLEKAKYSEDKGPPVGDIPMEDRDHVEDHKLFEDPRNNLIVHFAAIADSGELDDIWG
jgi:hypothetical protein